MSGVKSSLIQDFHPNRGWKYNSGALLLHDQALKRQIPVGLGHVPLYVTWVLQSLCMELGLLQKNRDIVRKFSRALFGQHHDVIPHHNFKMGS